jgi:hypothetical protein
MFSIGECVVCTWNPTWFKKTEFGGSWIWKKHDKTLTEGFKIWKNLAQTGTRRIITWILKCQTGSEVLSKVSKYEFFKYKNSQKLPQLPAIWKHAKDFLTFIIWISSNLAKYTYGPLPLEQHHKIEKQTLIQHQKLDWISFLLIGEILPKREIKD